MKSKAFLIVLFFAFGISLGFAQEKSKKEKKEEKKIEMQKQVEQWVNAKSFVFNAKSAMPVGSGTINISSGSYNVKFLPDTIESYLPFYGQAYGGIGYGGDDGLKFAGKPESFTVEQGKKNIKVKAVVKGERDTFTISLSVTYSGSASLTVNSTNRSTISFNGDITGINKQQ